MSDAKESGLLAWWFEPADGRLQYGDGRKPIKGRTHKVKKNPVLCESGLHASVRLLDALQYANSSIVWRVRLGGTIVHGDEKCAATERTYIQRMDLSQTLHEFAGWAAMQVIHLWDAPAVVRDFLTTGDETLRAAAWDSAWASARAAARDSAGATAWAAAWAAAGDAAGAAAWAAAGDSAWDAALAAARDSAGAAAWAAARDSAWDAARDSAWDKQNSELERRVLALMGEA